jgi:hypothetical protein
MAADRWMRALPRPETAKWRERIADATADVAFDTLPQRLGLRHQTQAIMGHSRARLHGRDGS